MCTVAELIEKLKTYPQDMQVGYQCFSEYMTLDAEEPTIVQVSLPRADGWIQRYRPDLTCTHMLMFPGN